MQIDNIEFKEDKDEFYHIKKKSKWKRFDQIELTNSFYLIFCENNTVELAKYYDNNFYNLIGQPIKYIKYIRKIKLPKKIKTLFH